MRNKQSLDYNNSPEFKMEMDEYKSFVETLSISEEDKYNLLIRINKMIYMSFQMGLKKATAEIEDNFFPKGFFTDSDA